MLKRIQLLTAVLGAFVLVAAYAANRTRPAHRSVLREPVSRRRESVVLYDR
jgi:hypothetical protein